MAASRAHSGRLSARQQDLFNSSVRFPASGFREAKFPVKRDRWSVRRCRFDIGGLPFEFVERRLQELTCQSASKVLWAYYQAVNAEVFSLITEFDYGCQTASNPRAKELTA